MANRIIKDLIWASSSLSKISLLANGFFLRLLPFPDDYGCFDARLAILRARLFPLMLDKVSENDIAGWLRELQGIDCVRLWVAEDGIEYGFIPAWGKHQQIRSVHRRKTPLPPVSVVSRGVNLISVDIKCDQPVSVVSRGVNLISTDIKCDQPVSVVSRGVNLISTDIKCDQPVSVDIMNPNPNLNPEDLKRLYVEFPQKQKPAETSTAPTPPKKVTFLNETVKLNHNQDPHTPSILPHLTMVETLDHNPYQTITQELEPNKNDFRAFTEGEFARAVIDDLNSVAKTRYKANNKNTLAHINARRREGFKLEDFKAVHKKKAAQWLNDPKMAPFLRPDTLYRPSKFESYLNEREVAPGNRIYSRPSGQREKTHNALVNWAKANEGRMHEQIGSGGDPPGFDELLLEGGERHDKS